MRSSLFVAMLLSACEAKDCPDGFIMNEDGLCLEEGEGEGSDSATGDDGGEGEGEGEDSGGSGGDSGGGGGDDTASPGDADGDGYESPEDCDDTDADVSPAATEVCGNGVDDDCDGSAGACGWSGETELPGDAITIRGENPSDHFGWRVEAGADLNGDAAPDMLFGSYGPDSPARHAGRAWVVLGPLSADKDAADADATISGESAEQQVGYDVAMLGDADGDGYDEIALSELAYDSRTYTYQGAVAVQHGPVDGELAWSDLDPWAPEEDGDRAGYDLARVGDVTGDGTEDLLVGAFRSSVYESYAGAAYVLNAPGEDGGDLGDADARLYGDNEAGDGDLAYGTAVGALGDANGDGIADVAVGAPGYDQSGGRYGAVFVHVGPLDGAVLSSDADAMVYGHGSRLGPDTNTVTGIGDQDGDGLDDLALGVPEESDDESYQGAVYVFSGAALDGEVSNFLADAILWGDSYGDQLGYGTAGVGDLDGDGDAEFLVGAWGSDLGGRESGVAWLVPGPVSGNDLASAVATASFVPEHAEEQLGHAQLGGVDLTGDGVGDLLLGAGNAEGEEAYSGVVYVLGASGF